jgi:hypothetical protein
MAMYLSLVLGHGEKSVGQALDLQWNGFCEDRGGTGGSFSRDLAREKISARAGSDPESGGDGRGQARSVDTLINKCG